MNRLFAKKFKGLLTAIMILACGCLLLLISAGVIYFQIRQQDKQAKLIEKQIEEDKVIYGDSADNLVERLQEKQLYAEKLYRQLKSQLSFDTDRQIDIITPLNFKQNLFEVQDKFRKTQDKLKVILPESLGFSEFEINVPDEAKTKVLARELLIMDELVNLLLESGVKQIRTIDFPKRATESSMLRLQVTEFSFAVSTIRLALEADYETLKEFLIKLWSLKNIYTVKKLEIRQDKTKVASLSVVMEIDNLNFADRDEL